MLTGPRALSMRSVLRLIGGIIALLLFWTITLALDGGLLLLELTLFNSLAEGLAWVFG